ncbi:hypothetical protein B0H19DRAFT_1076055 [Mycena capillaripes]|nr:hypothetical protein B0H19DRAFT_1076055 [Mycena capillaripes]
MSLLPLIHLLSFSLFLNLSSSIDSQTLAPTLLQSNMGSTENAKNQFFLPAKNLLSGHDNQNMLVTLQPELENGFHTAPTSIKPKHTVSFSQSPPSTPCRTPTAPLPDIGTLLSTPLMSGATKCPPGQTSRDRVDEAPIHVSGSRTADNNHDLFNATGRTDTNGMTSQREQAQRDGLDNVPPIAFLREPSQSVSPAFSARELSPTISRGSNASSGSARIPPTAAPIYQPFHTFAESTSNAPPPESASAAPSHTPFSTSFTFKANNYPAFPVPPSSSAPTRRSPVRPSSVPRQRPHDAAARTRAATGASAHEPAPRYKFTYNSLMRHPTASGRSSVLHENSTPAKQRELEAACEMVPARVGVRRGSPPLDFLAVAAAVEGLRGEQTDYGMDVDGRAGETERGVAGQWWVESRPNTAPTAAYATLLEETFPERALREKNGKPHRRAVARSKGRSASAATTTSSGGGEAGAGMDFDTDERASADLGANDGVTSRAREWIAEIQMVVKGKRQLVREDFKSLADTMRAIADMPAVEGRALGDDGPRLRKSIWQLAQLEDIPFRDEFKKDRICISWVPFGTYKGDGASETFRRTRRCGSTGVEVREELRTINNSQCGFGTSQKMNLLL